MAEELLVSEREMRQFLQFDYGDYPTQNDITFFIRLSGKKIKLDIESDNEDINFIATLLLTKSFILRGLATKSLSKGYIQATAEGRTITKAYQELVLEAENVYQEYKEFIVANGRREAARTNFLTNNSEISPITRQEIINIMNGVTNAENSELARRFDYFWRR